MKIRIFYDYTVRGKKEICDCKRVSCLIYADECKKRRLWNGTEAKVDFGGKEGEDDRNVRRILLLSFAGWTTAGDWLDINGDYENARREPCEMCVCICICIYDK
jgi:hypothetical protein